MCLDFTTELDSILNKGADMRVLCIDDDLDDLELLSEVMRTLHPEITCLMTTSGKEGLSMIEAVQPDLIFLDINMPEVDGRVVLETIRKNRAFDRVKVCILSTSISLHECDVYKKIGANYCVHKPSSFDTFKIAINRILEDNTRSVRHV